MGCEPFLALVLSTWVGQAGSVGCVKDIDCKGDRICVAGQCQSPQSVPPRSEPATYPTATAPASGRLGEVADSVVGIHADIGGVLFYGPAIDVEFGGNLAGFVEARAVGLGLVRWAVAGDTDGEHNSSSMTDFGLGAGFRYYFGRKANRQGFYLGGLTEYVSTDSVAKSKSPAYVYHTVDLLVGASVGYRWVFSNRMTLGAGGTAGFVHVLEGTSHLEGSSAPLPSGYSNTAADSVGGLLTLEVGFAL
jgi:hypothetical protein